MIQETKDDEVLQAVNTTDYIFELPNNTTAYKYYLLVIDEIKSTSLFGSKAFMDCVKLKTITLKNAKMKKNGFGKECFRNIKAKATFKVPAKMVKKYQKWLIGKAKAPETIKVKKGK